MANQQANQQEAVYTIPAKFRLMENLHIVFWLFKDLAWCMVWKPLGVFMIIPTLSIAFMIMINNRKIVSELCHNIAVFFWILANSYWMVSEFFHFDALFIYKNSITYKHLAVIPFVLGIITLFYYYVIYTKKKAEVVVQTAPAH
jgi:hypothetical protein